MKTQPAPDLRRGLCFQKLYSYFTVTVIEKVVLSTDGITWII